MASTTMTFDDSRAREEIGYSSRPRRSHSLIPRSGSSNTASHPRAGSNDLVAPAARARLVRVLELNQSTVGRFN